MVLVVVQDRPGLLTSPTSTSVLFCLREQLSKGHNPELGSRDTKGASGPDRFLRAPLEFLEGSLASLGCGLVEIVDVCHPCIEACSV